LAVPNQHGPQADRRKQIGDRATACPFGTSAICAMTLFIAAMVLASAAIHPFWNMLIKRHGDPRLSFIGLTVTITLCGFLHTLASGQDPLAGASVLPFILLSVSGQVLYGTCLTATLGRGDLSTYYPIIRASPVFVVVVGVALLGRQYSPVVLAGIAMVVAGGFFLLYRRGTNLLADPLTLGLAMVAMCGTGIYSLADAQLMRSIAPSVLVLWVDGFLIPYYVTLYILAPPRSARLKASTSLSAAIDPRAGLRPFRPFRPSSMVWLVVPGLMAYASYVLILTAYQLDGEVAAVTAVRQASIPISVLLGGYFLREGAILRRLLASTLLGLGIILIVITG